MAPLNLITSFFLFSSTILAQGSVTQKDFTGVGHIFVLKSDDWRTANPNQTIGCLDNHGNFVSANHKSDCGTFARLNDYPWTLSSKEGNCTFTNEKREKNTDSHYGGSDHAWSCDAGYVANIYDELYTIDGFSYPFLCFGDVACFYDAKRAPKEDEKLSLWQFRWGSQQLGITPGHVMLQLLWEKVGDLSKKESSEDIPGPRVQLKEGLQIPLQGQHISS